MIRYDRLITLMTLLHNRTYVTREQISRVCNVSERTVYRYINKLSMSNIPIYYDRNVGGYRLNSPSNIAANYLGLSDTIILKCALKYLEQKLNGEYSDAIASINKTLSRINLQVNVESGVLSESLFRDEITPDKLSSSIHLAILVTAIRNSQKVMVEYSNGTHKLQRNIVEKPNLRFSGEWQIFDSRDLSRHNIPLSKIREVKII